MPKIKLEGMEKLQVKLKKNVQMSDIKRVVKENGKALQEASHQQNRHHTASGGKQSCHDKAVQGY